jgi:uncharacterized protein YggU (UPF0235/DUF167 family)
VQFCTSLPAAHWQNARMSNLLLINLPSKASDREIREWIESRGIGTKSIRIRRDLVTGVASAFVQVELKSSIEPREAISILDGKRMRNQTVLAKKFPLTLCQSDFDRYA